MDKINIKRNNNERDRNKIIRKDEWGSIAKLSISYVNGTTIKTDNI